MTKPLPILVTEEKALRILGVRKTTLSRYVRNQLLTTVKVGGKSQYYVAQLMDLKEVRSRDRFTGMGVHEKLSQVSTQLELLTRRFRLLCDTLGLAYLDYNPTDQALSCLYEIAQAVIGSFHGGRPNRMFLERWLLVVPLLTAQEFRRLGTLYRSEQDPWKPFYLVTEELLRAVVVHYDLEKDPDADTLKVRLGLCQSKLQMAAMEFMKMDDPRVDPRKLLLERLESPLTPNPTRLLDNLIHELRDTGMDPDRAIHELYEMSSSLSAAVQRP